MNKQDPRWCVHTPLQPKPGVKCSQYLVVREFSDVASLEYFFFDENEWMDLDGNTFKVRGWLKIPNITSWRQQKPN